MKVQYLAVIFVIIIIPISLVMTQYLQSQIDTIKLQTAYTSNLDNATHNALKAFQINSVNNRYSSISDSKIRDIEASINTFYNALGTSMDMYVSSREQLSTFVPAILFNLYDGYYIYSSYNNIYDTTTTSTGEEKVEIKDKEKNYQDGLRPYIYYSCKYKTAAGDTIIVNYTLDNAITVYGDFGSGYETRSGYLIDPSKIDLLSIQDDIDTSSLGKVKQLNYKSSGDKKLKYDGIDIEPELLTEHLLTIEEDENGTVTTVEGDYQYIIYKNKKVYKEKGTTDDMTLRLKNSDNTTTDVTLKMPKCFWYDNNRKTYLQSEKVKLAQYFVDNGLVKKSTTANNTYVVNFKSISAFEYYIEALNFSKWVNNNTVLSGITQNNMIEFAGELSINTGNAKIFNTTADGNDPMLSSSTFNNHRMAVIRKSIETNLTTAIANYNLQGGSNYEFVLPIIDEESWYKITNNVSIASFMQGMPIGQKYYNNYSVITNSKNEEVINEQSIYVLTQKSVNDKYYYEYHQPGCKELIEKVNKGDISIIGVYTDLSFLRQTVKISESDIRYFYPQARSRTVNDYGTVIHVPTTTGCYNCIVNASGDYNIDSIISGKITDYMDPKKVIYDSTDLYDVRKAYLTGLARERYDLYKSNFDLKM